MTRSSGVATRTLPFSKGVRYMAYSAFLFSVMSLLVKAVGQRIPSQEIVFVRSVITLVLSAAGLYRIGESVWGEQRGLLTIRGVTGFGALLCFFYALTNLPLADATVIQYTNPVFTGIFAAIFIGESLRPVVIGGSLVSLVGVVLIAQPAFLFGTTSRLDPLAVGIALAGAVLTATAYVIVRQLRSSEHYLVIVFYLSLAGTIGALPLTLPDLVIPNLSELIGLLAIGVITQVAQVYLTRGLHEIEAGRATTIGYLQLVFAFIWGMLFFGEFPTLWSLTGALLIVISTFLVATRRK